MKRHALFLLCLVLSPATLASKDRVYRWTDADGVVHYSQTEPARVRAESIEIRRAPEPAPAPVAAPPPKPAVAETDGKVAAENCALARSNAQLLSGKGSVSMDKDGDGKMDPVTDEDRKNIQVETDKQITVFCKET